MKRGITATSVAIMIAVILILMSTITAISYNSIQNAKKIVFALEISNIQEEVYKYVKDSIDGSYPVMGDYYVIDLSNVSSNSVVQFDGENKDEKNQIELYEVDLTSLGIDDTSYGNKKNEKDVYTLSKTTGKVYYIQGIKCKDVTYYTLTKDLLDLKDRKSKTAVIEESTKPIITSDGFVTIASQGGSNKSIYLSNISVKNNPKIFKYEEGIIPESNAKSYFSASGKTITSDRLSFKKETDVTLYAENDKGEYDIKYFAYKAPIPAGFYYVGGEVSTGVVISDNIKDQNKGYDTTGNVVSEGLLGNQFVWVPVDDISKFKITTTYNGVITEPADGNTEPFSQSIYVSGEKIVLSLTNDLTGEWAEFTAMKESVEKYGGFYIGRYEAGSSVIREDKANGTTSVVIKKGAYPYNYVGWGTSMISVTDDIVYNDKNQGKGVVVLSRNMYKSSNSVVSTLCYGVQWDAALTFISKTDSTYALNSTNKGWYNDNASTGNPTQLTGVDLIENGKIMNAPCNIYDMAGNKLEWTMESASTDNGGRYRTARGGSKNGNGKTTPASYRSYKSSELLFDSWTFRVTLYLK